jgi:hypothetical protein
MLAITFLGRQYWRGDNIMKYFVTSAGMCSMKANDLAISYLKLAQLKYFHSFGKFIRMTRM